MLIVIYAVALILYWNFSIPLKLVGIVVNLFLPDPVPFLDELAMGAMLAKHLASGSKD